MSGALHRAYSVLEIKAIDDEQRVIEGIATTPATDRTEDIVEPLGATFKLPLPFMWQHGKDPFVGQTPVGNVVAATPTATGIPVRIQMAQTSEPGRLKDILDFAWQSVRKGLVRGLSIGMRPTEDPEPIKGTYGLRFKRWEWLELSGVTIPANAEASIVTVKSLAQELAASGTGSEGVVRPSPAGVGRITRTLKDVNPTMKTYSEQIHAFETTLQAKQSRLDEIQAKASAEGRTKDATEKEEFDTLKLDIEQINGELKDLRDLETMNKKAAVEVKAATPDEGAQARGGHSVIRVQPTLDKGIGFARLVKCSVVAKLEGRRTAEIAAEMYPSDDRLKAHAEFMQRLPQIMAHIKAAVPAGTTTQTDWASALVNPANLDGEFVDFLRPETIIGRLNLRNIPFNVRIVEQTQGGTGYWVGQGAPKPLTAFGFAPITNVTTKVAAISVITEELARLSSPSADLLVRNGLRDALIERIDRDLLDPAEAGTTNVQPRSLTNGLTALTSAGTDPEDVVTDLGKLIGTIRAANIRGPIVVVLPDVLATAVQFMTNSFGQPFFPEAGNGTLRGVRFLASQYLANSSGAGNMVVAIAENEVFLSDDGAVTVDASRETALQMLDNPTNNSAVGTATSMVSMFQTNSIALRGERYINWSKRRDDAVAYLDDVNWGSVGSPA